MKVVIVGAGIGGLTTALALHEIGIEAEVYEQARELRELGVGINMLPHAIKELAAFGMLPALDAAGIRTRELIYANRFGQTVWQELRGIEAGYDTPQFSIHRGKLHGLLLRAALERLGPQRIHTCCRLTAFREEGDTVIAAFEDRAAGRAFVTAGDVLIGADGIHSKVRSQLYPQEGAPIWNGIMLWRGALDWPVYGDGRTMMIAGGNDAKFVLYPIHADPTRPEMRLTNWAVMARIADGTLPPPRKED
jgi:2-polyprenyl-6-methoxyphenol hydroxylase-like FAD-dependent oxidoreductase